MFTVDRDDVEAPEVGAPAQVVLAGVHRAGAAGRAGQPPRFDDCRLSVGIRQTVLANDDLGVDARVLEVAQHFDDAPDGPPGRRRPPDDVDGNHRARLCTERLGGRNGDVGLEASVEWSDEPDSRRVHVEPPDDALVGALEDLDDSAFGPVAAAEPLDPHDHPVPMHRLVKVRRGNEHVWLAPVARRIGGHERVASGLQLQPAHDEIHLVGQTVALAAHFHQQALGDEALELAPEGGALLSRNRQELHQLARRGRVLGLLANRAEQLFS